MSRYNTFAKYYDQVVGDREEVACYFRALISRYHPKALSLLELGCGSGSMLKPLSKYYKCTGIDLSKSMLAMAANKAPKAHLILGDITKFNLNQKFDVVICPFDTINHITSFSGWRKVFKNAHNHLNSSGIFIFDVNTEYKMESYSAAPELVSLSDALVSIIEVKRQAKNRYDVIHRLFEKQKRSGYKLHRMVLPEIVVPTSKIVDALSVYFKSVVLIDADRRKPNQYTQELYLVCCGPR